MRIKTTLQLIIITSSLFLVNTAITSADDDMIVNISPIIIVDSTQSKNNGEKLLLQQSTNTKPVQSSTKSLENQNRLQQDQHNPYSLALGANIQLNNTLNIGAACGIPLMNSEPVQIDDLSIEAMVTMQF